MRCVLRPMTRVVRSVLPIVLLLAVASSAAAQSIVCHTIRRGESATEVARRLTGDGRNAYRTWFEIKNPSSRSLPKSQYDRIRAGWQACVIGRAAPPPSETVPLSDTPETVVADVALTTAEAIEVAGERPPPIEPSAVLRTVRRVDLTMLWLGAAMVVPWVGWRILDDYLVRRKTASIVMRHFAHRFVDEFERPLVRYDAAERAVRARLRTSVRRGRLDILLAPGNGHRYPNLSDHKKNVEYDVARVMNVLADDSFVRGPLSMHAEWVVVPLRFRAGPK
jgi:hypothetical protein